nr:hypothetical protein CFP56_09027 [Quercus suber]
MRRQGSLVRVDTREEVDRRGIGFRGEGVGMLQQHLHWEPQRYGDTWGPVTETCWCRCGGATTPGRNASTGLASVIDARVSKSDGALDPGPEVGGRCLDGLAQRPFVHSPSVRRYLRSICKPRCPTTRHDDRGAGPAIVVGLTGPSYCAVLYVSPRATVLRDAPVRTRVWVTCKPGPYRQKSCARDTYWMEMVEVVVLHNIQASEPTHLLAAVYNGRSLHCNRNSCCNDSCVRV